MSIDFLLKKSEQIQLVMTIKELSGETVLPQTLPHTFFQVEQIPLL